MLLIATVEPIGDSAHVVFVFTDIGIQEATTGFAPLGPPKPGAYSFLPSGIASADEHRVTVGRVGEKPQRQTPRVQ